MACPKVINDHEFGELMAPFSLCAPFAVAVSGGVDSLALTYLAHRYAMKHNLAMTALTVDHRLREESTTEAETVHTLLAEHGISHQILTWEHDHPLTTKIQEQARLNRYALLGNWCQENDVQTLLTAHHQGDHVETFFMRLAHRSGLKGLSSMRACTRMSFGVLIRPLLTLSKERLIATLTSFGLTWHDDPSNNKVMYERVRLRQALANLNDADLISMDAVSASIQKLQYVDDYLDECAESFFRTHSVSLFPLNAFNAEHPVLKRRMLMHILRRLSPHYYGAPDDLIERTLDCMMKPTFKGTTLGGLYLRRAAGGMIDVRREKRRD